MAIATTVAPVAPPQLPTVASPTHVATTSAAAAVPSATTTSTAELLASVKAVFGGAPPFTLTLLELSKKTTPVTALVRAQHVETHVVRNNGGEIQVFFKLGAADATEIKASAWGAAAGILYGCDAITFHRVWKEMKETQGVGMSEHDLLFLKNTYDFCGQSAPAPQPKDFIIKFTGKFFNFVRYA